MKGKLNNEESKLLFITTTTLSVVLFFIATADFFFSSKRVLFYPTLVLLIINTLTNIAIKKTYGETLKFIDFLFIIIYFSFLAHYFFIDLIFVAVFCLLLLYITVLFNGYRKFILISLTILCITFLLFLLREQNYSYRSSHDSHLYIGYLRSTSTLAIVVLFYFVLDFRKKTQKLKFTDPSISRQENISPEQLSELFQCIKRKDSSFMPLFFSTHPIFVDKIKEIHPKINAAEIEICALIKLGLSNKEIAIATNSTYKAIESSKYRIRKKLNLDSTTNMMLFLNEL